MMQLFAFLGLWAFSTSAAIANPTVMGCSQYGRDEMGLGLSLLLVVLLIGQRRRDHSNSTAL